MPDETILSDESTETEGTEDVTTEVSEESKNNEEKSDTKSAEEEGTGKDSIADKPPGAPETYEEFTIPEGMQHDETVLAEATDIFKEIGLTQKQAQTLVDFDMKSKQDLYQKSLDAWSETMDGWKKEAANDKEFGGTSFEANVALAKKGRDAFGSEDFIQMLDVTGVGNHPEMIRFLVKLGKVVSEDNILQGTSSINKEKPAEQIMFPNM